MSCVDNLKKKFNLKQHVEGGYFFEYYKSSDTYTIPINGHDEQRNSLTAIYFLIDSNNKSTWHKLKSDELLFYQCGSSANFEIINSETGELKTPKMGHPLDSDAMPCIVVPRDHWFAFSVCDKDSYTFMSCTVSPGFEYTDFELGDTNKLIELFPQHESIIKMYSR